MGKTEKNVCRIVISAVICFAAVLLSLCIGVVIFSPAQIFRFLIHKGEINESIFWLARVPRTFGGLFAGAALSVSGAVLQNVLSNKLASPGIIGVNAGAGLGVAIACALGALSGWAISASAFMGSILTVLAISLFANKTGASRTTVILAGAALNSILNASSEALTVLVPDAAPLSLDFRVGGFSSVSYSRLIPAGIMILAAFILLMTLCNELDIITLGDDTARGLGLAVGKYRILFLILSALLAGAAVSFSGLLGFVGLIVPHFIRRFSGSESRILLPLCALLGGAFVVAADLAARQLFSPFQLPVGIIMAIIGAPLFIFALVRTKGGHGND